PSPDAYDDDIVTTRLKPPDEKAHDARRAVLQRLVYSLYEHPTERVIGWAGYDPTEVVFLIWAQQWPRLRRSFRFCTLAFGDRSTEGARFDLQFVPDARLVRARFSGAVD